MSEKLKVAILVEYHPYDVINFQKMLESFDGCESYVQPLDLFVRDFENNRPAYDTVVYYNMNNPIPKEGSALYKYFTEEAGASKQGMIFLHHALLSFKQWDLFTDICGLRFRGETDIFKYTQNQSVNIKIANAPHPVTAGAADFTIIDETYLLEEPDVPGNQILITTDNETSLKNIGWARQYKNSRVFCFASGHDNHAFASPGFRKILHNAILWTSGK
ncbi:MAG: ThuA domain-containing protein [Oscillospiraceae bacterium]|nr:ThuA domain-containing protein [Oscillospiraceae bacterium]